MEQQEKSHLIAKELMPADSEYLNNSKSQLNKFMMLSIAKEKKKVHEQGSREFGANPKMAATASQE